MRDESLIQNLGALRCHGIDRPAWDRFSKKGSPHYDVIMPALKFNMMDIQGALGMHQLAHLPTMLARRAALVQRYCHMLQDRTYLKLPPRGEGHSWHLFAPQINEDVLGLSRDEVVDLLKSRFNIGTSIHYTPVHLFTCYRQAYGFQEGDFPHAEHVGRTTISLPLFPDMTVEDQDRVVHALDQLAHEYRG